MIRQRKKIRLASRNYSEANRPCSITICTRVGIRISSRKECGLSCIETLVEYSVKTNVPVLAYCFMPDHVHLLLAASSTCSIPSFVGGFKSLSMRELRIRFGHGDSFWQKRYYDHFLRADEDIHTVVRYIMQNPVRKGLVSTWKEYPLSGSLVYSLGDWD